MEQSKPLLSPKVGEANKIFEQLLGKQTKEFKMPFSSNPMATENQSSLLERCLARHEEISNSDESMNLSASSSTPSSTTVTSPDSGIDSPCSENNENEELFRLDERVNLLLGNAESTPSTSRPNMRTRKQKDKKSFCKVCNENIFKDGQRSQGPRRHIMQKHLLRPVFKCPLCTFSSNYDKAHVHNHCKRIHGSDKEQCIEMDRQLYATEERLWDQACFGKDSTGEISTELAALNRQNRENDPVEQEQPAMNPTFPAFPTMPPFNVFPVLPPSPLAVLNPVVNLQNQLNQFNQNQLNQFLMLANLLQLINQPQPQNSVPVPQSQSVSEQTADDVLPSFIPKTEPTDDNS